MERRKTLKNGRGSRKQIDMPKVYQELDSGRSVKSVAEEWGVSPSTLHRRHHEYQAGLAMILDELPPLPEDMDTSFRKKENERG